MTPDATAIALFVPSDDVASVLVLDEPTAALDPISERAVVDGCRTVMRGRTTLVISHRREVAAGQRGLAHRQQRRR